MRANSSKIKTKNSKLRLSNLTGNCMIYGYLVRIIFIFRYAHDKGALWTAAHQLSLLCDIQVHAWHPKQSASGHNKAADLR